MAAGMWMAVVTELLPEVAGVRVRFEDLVLSGFAENDYVRVLQPRMSPSGGAAIWLPEVGELGIVALLDGGAYVWMGSLPFQDANQAPATPGILYVRHQSGASIQVLSNGDLQVRHPSGARVTIAQEAGEIPEPNVSGQPVIGGVTSAPVMQVSHPSGAMVEVDAGGNGKIHGFASLVFQDGEGRFAMDSLVTGWLTDLTTWAKAHTHTSSSPGYPTSAPVQAGQLAAPKVDATCSPETFKGPRP